MQPRFIALAYQIHHGKLPAATSFHYVVLAVFMVVIYTRHSTLSPLASFRRFGNVPSVNSLESVYMMLERPLVHAQLTLINKRLGEEAFPVIPQCFFSTHRDMMYVACVCSM